MAKATNWKNRIVGEGVQVASQFIANPANWRTHPQNQRDAMRGALNEVGWVQRVIVNRRTGYLVDGHERVWQALQNGDAEVPYVEVDLTEAEEAYVLATLDPIGAMAQASKEQLGALLAEVQSGEAGVQAMLAEVAEKAGLYADDMLSAPKDAKPNSRNLPIDVIYTLQGADCTCCLVVQAGLRYGIQSGGYSLCPYTAKLSGRHKVFFVDNDYLNYDHAKHLGVVRDHRPKYATVRDVMTEAQCARAGIEFFSLERILGYAEELAEYAENVIVIPKYDCLDAIPDRYVLGYSVPTSHGGTPLPVELFKGRRVHLLGGSWKAQLAHMFVLGEDVVSLDNNYVAKQARFAGFIDKEGNGRSLSDIGLGELNNPRYAALALSFGAMGAKISELYAGTVAPA